MNPPDLQTSPVVGEETISTVYAFQLRLGTLFAEFLRGDIDSARIDFDRKAWPTKVTLKTLRTGQTGQISVRPE